MSDCIFREAAIQAICNQCEANGNCGHTCAIVCAIESIPAADAIEELSRVLDSYERSAKEWAEEAYRAYRKYSESIFGSPKEG